MVIAQQHPWKEGRGAVSARRQWWQRRRRVDPADAMNRPPRCVIARREQHVRKIQAPGDSETAAL